MKNCYLQQNMPLGSKYIVTNPFQFKDSAQKLHSVAVRKNTKYLLFCDVQQKSEIHFTRSSNVYFVAHRKKYKTSDVLRCATRFVGWVCGWSEWILDLHEFYYLSKSPYPFPLPLPLFLPPSPSPINHTSPPPTPQSSEKPASQTHSPHPTPPQPKTPSYYTRHWTH